MLRKWVADVAAELGIELEIDIGEILDLARDAAHGVERTAAPLTTFLVGYAAAQTGGGSEAVREATARVRALIPAPPSGS